jgi:hypothetical protein
MIKDGAMSPSLPSALFQEDAAGFLDERRAFAVPRLCIDRSQKVLVHGDRKPQRSAFQFRGGDDNLGVGARVRGIGENRLQARRYGDAIAVLCHSLDVKSERLLGHRRRLVKVGTGGHTGWKVGKLDGVIAVRILIDQSDVITHLGGVPPSRFLEQPIGCKTS